MDFRQIWLAFITRFNVFNCHSDAVVTENNLNELSLKTVKRGIRVMIFVTVIRNSPISLEHREKNSTTGNNTRKIEINDWRSSERSN